MSSGAVPVSVSPDAADLHRVVRDEPVAALDELDGCLALADAAVAEDQHALAVHVHQHAVARDHGRQLVVEEVDGHARKLDRGAARAQQGAAVFLRHLHALGEHVELAGDDQRRDLILEQILKAFAPLGGGKALEEHRLRLADDLEPARVKVVEKADELQPRAVDVRGWSASPSRNPHRDRVPPSEIFPQYPLPLRFDRYS